MYTRKQFDNNECSQSEYYSQFVNENIKKAVIAAFSKNRILGGFIPTYDNIIPSYNLELLYTAIQNSVESSIMKDNNEFISLGFVICIAKEAANQIRS
jgi:predicted nuclease of restriction endonuclease-like RecB superfamily